MTTSEPTTVGPDVADSREITLVHPTSQHTNLPPLVEGPAVRLVGRHAKVRREGYRNRQWRAYTV
jgi:hypothetical protein